MGIGVSADNKEKKNLKKDVFRLIPDQYKTYDDLNAALRRAGFENCEVVLAIDFTGSNREQGKLTFGGRDLHYPHELLLQSKSKQEQDPKQTLGEPEVEGKLPQYVPLDDDESLWNPYQKVISAMSTALETLSPAKRIHVLGFGDVFTEDHSVFCVNKRANGHGKSSIVRDLIADCSPCHGVQEVMNSYVRALPNTVKSGPTSFVPVLDIVSDYVRKTRRFCFVFMVGDGMVSEKAPNASAIVRASTLPISISFVGVGDGPWHNMEEFDDELPERAFDNFQFVQYDKKMRECAQNTLRFATHALMEVPDQLAAIRKLKYI
jgi:E3 ubiquitin-protein ligase RGLG